MEHFNILGWDSLIVVISGRGGGPGEVPRIHRDN